MLEAGTMESEIGPLTVERVDDDVAVLSLQGERVKVSFHPETAPIVQRVFEVLGASGRWPLHRSREDAIAAVRPGSEIGRRGGRQKTYTGGDAIPIHVRGEAGVTEVASADPVPIAGSSEA